MRIGIDIMGGDYAPREAVKGLADHLAAGTNSAGFVLFGNAEEVRPLLEERGLTDDRITLVNTTQVIGMQEHPTRAFREKTDASITVGFGWLAAGKTDAFISAGNTGAMLVGALFSIQPIEGVIRPAISTIIPKLDGGTGLLLDVGLNADCKPEQLNQFATMGSVYAQQVLGIDNPGVGLINVGEEEGKGNLLAQATYPLLKENRQIRFIGNIEGRDLFTGPADVMVCEGFTGNIILKMAESLFDIGRARQITDPYLERFNFENYGGTPVLGISKPVIIGHGISGARAFRNMISLAERMIGTDVMQKLKEGLS
ncbi:MAG: hypothetical protein RJA57_1958 [Bacteroidota bacterium]|jgi:glycerol-3-phosphate acyltransferase PlsX